MRPIILAIIIGAFLLLGFLDLLAGRINTGIASILLAVVNFLWLS